MKLYVCWGTMWTPRPGGHPCHKAYEALREAGHDPKVVRVYGLGIGPRLLQWKTSGRRAVEELSGSPMVPVLVTDDGRVINDSARIADWAANNPAA
jgi:glutathione S-transferase